MGRVDLALERAGGVERIVALKRIRRELANNERNVDLFLREARLAALISHPSVVHTLAFGDGGGELYLAMEYVDGETLSAVLERARAAGTPLEPALALHILAAVCDGLHVAHELCDARGEALSLVHRDLTPQNVMIAYDGQVKLLDFGIAKIEAGAALTRTGEIRGKTAYMAPEQAMGDCVDRRSDIYAVGVLLYEALVGEKQWGEGSDLAVLRRMAFGPPPRLEGVAEDVCILHETLVRTDPADRLGTAREVALALRSTSLGSATQDALAARMQALFADDTKRKREVLRAALIAAPGPAAASDLAPVALAVRSPMTLVKRRRSSAVALGLGAAVMALIAAGYAGSWRASRLAPPVAAIDLTSRIALPPRPADAATAAPGVPSQGAVAKAAPSAAAAPARPRAQPSAVPVRAPSAAAPRPSTDAATGAAAPPIDVDPDPI